jgi:hypothetical protein
MFFEVACIVKDSILGIYEIGGLQKRPSESYRE